MVHFELNSTSTARTNREGTGLQQRHKRLDSTSMRKGAHKLRAGKGTFPLSQTPLPESAGGRGHMRHYSPPNPPGGAGFFFFEPAALSAVPLHTQAGCEGLA